MIYYWGTLYAILSVSILVYGVWITYKFFRKKYTPPYEGEDPPSVDEPFLKHYYFYGYKIAFYIISPIIGPLLILLGCVMIWNQIALIFNI